MRVSIAKFSLSLLSIFTAIFLSIAIYIYYEQQENTASVILKSMNSQISEVSYIISKSVKNKADMPLYRALLDRIAVNSDFIKLIHIYDEHKILLSTDPFFKEILSHPQLTSSYESAYEELMKIDALESQVRFYEGDKLVWVNLIFVLDKEEIERLFYRNSLEFLFFFLSLPLLMIALVWYIIKRSIVRPLELLRQFVYYQSEIPKAFRIQELETIRYSMVQTFDRLENEKKELYAIARTDSLSGLANRNALMEYLERLIALSKRREKEFAMLFLDLDHFKSVNDSLGHNVGDELLKKIATIIDNVLRSDDFVARVGGDEFVVILQNYTSMHELIRIVERIQETLTKTIVVQANPINVSSSIGIAFYPKDGESIVSLMKNSDIAMYEAKKSGRSRYHFFTEELNERVQETIHLEKEMRDALVHDEYEMYYQPKVDLKTSKIVGAEALIRWNSPTRGVVTPNVFIPLAEENGFIVELGEWIVDAVIERQALWMKKGLEISVSINLSSKQLLSKDFILFLINTVNKYSANPKFIDIEITEYMFYENSDKNIEILSALHQHGFSISLDDFGTEYKIALSNSWDDGIYECAMKGGDFQLAKQITEKNLKDKSVDLRKKWLYRYIAIDFAIGNYSEVIGAAKDLIVLLDTKNDLEYQEKVFSHYTRVLSH